MCIRDIYHQASGDTLPHMVINRIKTAVLFIALWCSDPLRYKVGGPIKGLAILCGLGPPGKGGGYPK